MTTLYVHPSVSLDEARALNPRWTGLFAHDASLAARAWRTSDGRFGMLPS